MVRLQGKLSRIYIKARNLRQWHRKLIVLCSIVSIVGTVQIVRWTIRKNNRIVFPLEVPDFQEEDHQLLHLPHYDSARLCPKKSPLFIDQVIVDETLVELDTLTRKYIPYRHGGHFKPTGCVSRTKTAVIIAYRNRERHLVVLLNHIIPFLVRQQAEFAIFVVELAANVTFNRALLMNVGFVEAQKTNNFTCFVFHDVDLIPESDYNLYRCGNSPRHMAVSNSKYGYQLLFPEYVGGVVSMSGDIYKKANGHSNLYFGWGGEDDDMLYRVMMKNYSMSRYPPDVGKYTALSHDEDVGNPINTIRDELLLSTTKRMDVDGLNSLKYTTVEKKYKQFYTWILVDIDVSYYNRTISKWIV